MTAQTHGFDPLWSDDPIDVPIDVAETAAIAADDALIEAIASANPDAIRAVIGLGMGPDELTAMLGAWVQDVRTTHLRPVRGDIALCCRRPVGELPVGDFLTEDEDLVTCPEWRRA